MVVGGDGTLNEVLNGLADPGRIAIAQLPTGTANILARELDFAWDPEGVVALLEQGEVLRIDMGLVGERRFLMNVTAGFDAEVTKRVREQRTGKLGFLGYVRPILDVLEDYEPPELRVMVDDDGPFVCELVVASSTRNYGGLFKVSEEARPDSGHLDVCMFTKAGLPELVRLGTAALFRGVAESEGVVYWTGTRISIDAQEPAPVQVDGDYFGTTPTRIELRPRLVPFGVPAGGPDRT